MEFDRGNIYSKSYGNSAQAKLTEMAYEVKHLMLMYTVF